MSLCSALFSLLNSQNIQILRVFDESLCIIRIFITLCKPEKPDFHRNLNEKYFETFDNHFLWQIPFELNLKNMKFSEFYQEILHLGRMMMAALNWTLGLTRIISSIFLSRNYIRITALFFHCCLAVAPVWKRIVNLYRSSPGTALPSRGQDSAGLQTNHYLI